VTWRPAASECGRIAGGWETQALGDIDRRFGLASAVVGAQHAYAYQHGILRIAGFHEQWTLRVAVTPPAAAGMCDFSTIGALLMGGLPASSWAAVMSHSPRVAAQFEHLHTPPPRVWHALHVGRPDLYWLVASAWHAMKVLNGTTLEALTSATDDVCSAIWEVDAGTRAYADILTVFRIAQIVAIATAPGGQPDVTIKGSPNDKMASVSIAPRDKMIAVFVLAWASGIDWAHAPPPGAPEPILSFIDRIH